MNNEIAPFEFGGRKVRMAGTPDAPLFRASDVCVILGLTNVGDALARLRDSEKSNIATTDVSKKYGKNCNLVPGAKSIVYVTEAGLYKLVFSSRKAEAERFQDWVTSEVLPEIRRKGAYSLVERSERKRIVEACFLALPAKQATLFDPLIESLRGLARKSDGGSGGTPPWARMIASWIYTWTFSKYKGEIRKRNPVTEDGALVWRDYETLSEEGRRQVSLTIGIACFAAREARSWDDWKGKMEAFFSGATYQNWLPFTGAPNQLPRKKAS